jgi:hypothetical protein
MSEAKTLSSPLVACVIAGIPLMTALLSIGGVHARNDGFKRALFMLTTIAFYPEHGHERKRAASEESFERFFVYRMCEEGM